MSELKATPGPWTFGVRDDGSIWQSRGNPLEGAHHQDDFFGTEADAHLIAAAPALYEALETFVADCTNEECEFCIKGRAALKLARGETA